MELVSLDIDNPGSFKDKEFVDNLIANLYKIGFKLIDLEFNEDQEYWKIKLIDPKNEGSLIEIDSDFFSSPELRNLFFVSKQIRGLLKGKLYKITGSDGEHISDTPDDLLKELMERGKKGLEIQRYKGLGEMNPEQLWVTTMDPERRRLLQVKIDDMVEADGIFTILMGDKVEARREFIQNNALEVEELDI